MELSLIHEANYAGEMESRVLPALSALRRAGTVTPNPDQPIYYELYRPRSPRGWVVISHGLCESIPKYWETIWYFLQAGYAVAMPEHRGHGRSFRPVADLKLTHVERFDDYVEDFLCFLRAVVLPEAEGLPLYLFGHSMGAAIALRAVEEVPTLPVKKLVLSSPMVAPKTQGLPRWLALAMTRLAVALGRGDRYILGQQANVGPESFGERWCNATSQPRYLWFCWLAERQPELQNASVSYGWLREALLVEGPLLEAGAGVSVPVLVCQAGQDAMVKSGPQDALLERLPQGEKALFPQAKHEIYRSDDATVAAYFSRVLVFLA
ncbi:MAG: alpha/beta hydrolase [Clostridiales bacterium]|nr:alpha/beta hydrolase [Clostridiales bacterium]